MGYSPTPLSISTMTITAETNGYIPALKEAAFQLRDLLPNKKGAKNFNNQVTFLVPIPGTKRSVNVKLFRNGKVQTSGSRNEDDALLVKHVCSTRLYMDLTNFKTVMINSNFSLGFPLTLIDVAKYFHQMGMFVTFDPSRHPPVNVRYKFNEHSNHQNGICNCLNRGTAQWDEATQESKTTAQKTCTCQSITCLIFGSGKVVITGSRSIPPLLAVYHFLVDKMRFFFSE